MDCAKVAEKSWELNLFRGFGSERYQFAMDGAVSEKSAAHLSR